jgi:hypothetical protein
MFYRYSLININIHIWIFFPCKQLNHYTLNIAIILIELQNLLPSILQSPGLSNLTVLCPWDLFIPQIPFLLEWVLKGLSIDDHTSNLDVGHGMQMLDKCTISGQVSYKSET